MVEIKRKFDLEDRLVDFSVNLIQFCGTMPKRTAALNLSRQLERSGSSVSLNYGEAQSAESSKDFIHKMKIVLKELRESFVCLKVINRSGLYNSENKAIIEKLLDENNQLIAIFVASIITARKNSGEKRK